MAKRDPSTALLACPVCGAALGDVGGDDSRRGGSARCPEGHSFDYARSGYLNLTRGSGRGRVGDTAEMVKARAEFLQSRHYEPLAEEVAHQSAVAFCSPEGDKRQPQERSGPVVAEIGCGTGYYLNAVVRALAGSDERPGCAFGFDLSKAAVDRAAREHPGLRFAVADVEEGIPLRDSTADLVLSAFAPRPGPELARITKPGGSLVVAFAGSRHLEVLRERLHLIGIGGDKLDRLSERLAPGFDLAGTTTVQYEATFSAEEARRLVLMGPNARHNSDTGSLDGELTDQVSVVVTRFQRSERPATSRSRRPPGE